MTRVVFPSQSELLTPELLTAALSELRPGVAVADLRVVEEAHCDTGSASTAARAVLDLDYQAEQGAFYYVRALQNPTCRWSTYDAIRLGREPDPGVPAAIRERVWSSPIWIDARSGD